MTTFARNSFHVPDIVHVRLEKDELFEVKVVSSLIKTTSLGKGSTRYGGNPASVGHTYAFGNTLEKMKLKVMGVKQRGHASDRPFDHATGLGYVAARNGDYVDALERKKLRVTLLLTEPLGGIAPDGVKFLGRLTGMADPTVRGTRDDTAYTCWSAPPHPLSWPIMACASPLKVSMRTLLS